MSRLTMQIVPRGTTKKLNLSFISAFVVIVFIDTIKLVNARRN